MVVDIFRFPIDHCLLTPKMPVDALPAILICPTAAVSSWDTCSCPLSNFYAEMDLCAPLMQSRQVPESRRFLNEGKWDWHHLSVWTKKSIFHPFQYSQYTWTTCHKASNVDIQYPRWTRIITEISQCSLFLFPFLWLEELPSCPNALWHYHPFEMYSITVLFMSGAFSMCPARPE